MVVEVGGVLRAGGDEEAGHDGPAAGRQVQMRPTLISTVLQVAVSAFVYVRSPLSAISTRLLEAQVKPPMVKTKITAGFLAAWQLELV